MCRHFLTPPTDIARPNADTLYSLMWFDVSKEPLLISVPDSGGRYYLLPMVDMWTEVFQSTGERTTGTSAQLLAIAEPRWQGQLPAGAVLVRSPTAIGWVIGRTQTNGKGDDDAVLGQISSRRQERSIPIGILRRRQSTRELGPAIHSRYSRNSQKLNPPHVNDYPILDQMQRMGIEPGKPFAFAKPSPEVQRALTEAGPIALDRMKARFLRDIRPRDQDVCFRPIVLQKSFWAF